MARKRKNKARAEDGGNAAAAGQGSPPTVQATKNPKLPLPAAGAQKQKNKQQAKHPQAQQPGLLIIPPGQANKPKPRKQNGKGGKGGKGAPQQQQAGGQAKEPQLNWQQQQMLQTMAAAPKPKGAKQQSGGGKQGHGKHGHGKQGASPKRPAKTQLDAYAGGDWNNSPSPEALPLPSFLDGAAQEPVVRQLAFDGSPALAPQATPPSRVVPPAAIPPAAGAGRRYPAPAPAGRHSQFAQAHGNDGHLIMAMLARPSQPQPQPQPQRHPRHPQLPPQRPPQPQPQRHPHTQPQRHPHTQPQRQPPPRPQHVPMASGGHGPPFMPASPTTQADQLKRMLNIGPLVN